MSIEMFRGDSRDQRIQIVKKSDNLPVDISSAKIYFSVRRYDKDAQPIFQYKNAAAGGTADQIEMTDPTQGKITVHIAAADTAKVVGGERYWYDLQLVFGIKVTTVLKNRILFKQDITY